MANRYWVGGSGNWSDTSHWSTTSGGSSGASQPAASDSVYFDANSALASFNVSFEGVQNFSLVTLSIKPSYGFTYTNGGYSFVKFSLSGIFDHNSNASFDGFQLTLNGTGTSYYGSSVGSGVLPDTRFYVGGSGTLSLTANSTIGLLSLNGTSKLLTNGYDIRFGQQGISTSGSQTLTLGASTLILDKANINSVSINASTTVSAASATFNVAGLNNSFDGGGKTYGTLNILNGLYGSYPLTISSNNTFGSISVESGQQVSFASGTTQTIGTLIANGTSSKPITLRSLTPGTRFFFAKSSGTVDIYYADIKDSSTSGGATWNANNSIDSGNNSGWNFLGPSMPVASFTNSSATGGRPLAVTFTDTSKGIPDTWLWTFGDGTTSTAQNPVKAYTAAGTYTVSLKASNVIGDNTITKTNLVTVNPTLPVASFTGSPTTGMRPLPVTFTNSSTNGSTYLWDFGDGTTSTAASPTKTYSTGGSWTVKLTATNVDGSNTLTRTSYITTTVTTYQRSVSGTFTMGGGISPRKVKFNRSITGNFTMGGNISSIRRGNTNVLQQKTFLYKVYNELGEFQGIYNDVISDLTFTKELNTAGSSVDIELARNSDSRDTENTPLTTAAGINLTTNNGFTIDATTQSKAKVGPGSDVVHNYRVDIWQYYGSVTPLTTAMGVEFTTAAGDVIEAVQGSPNGRVKFSGFISQINTKYGSTETTSLTLMSYGYDLDQYLLDDATGKTTIAYNSKDPSEIVKLSLDRFRAVSAGTYTNYTPTTIDNTSTTVSYTYKVNTYLEVIKKALELAPADWYWHVDLGSNNVNFHPRALQPKHVFYLGLHIKDLNLRSSIEGVVNDVVFTGGEVTEGVPSSTLFRRYTRTPSAYTRRGLERMSDGRVTLTASADLLANGQIDEKNSIQYKTSISILDKAYPQFEAIEVGDTVGFKNFGVSWIDTLVLQVVGLTYTPDILTLQLDTLSPAVPKRLIDLKRNQTEVEVSNVPDTPVVV